jgi:hypothetical protein
MPAFPWLTSRHWGGHNKEKSMTIFDLALVLNAMARLVAATATLITTIHRRHRG